MRSITVAGHESQLENIEISENTVDENKYSSLSSV